LGEKVTATYALLADGRTAVIELAAVSGLRLAPPGKRRPLAATTYGTGELIADALRCGARRLIVGLGGSATIDCGCGLAQALGVRLYDADDRELGRGGGALIKLARIDLAPLLARLLAACDVNNPLVGRRGGVRVYSKQKGATPTMIERLERGAANFARVVKAATGSNVSRVDGAGAAGGAGAGLMALLGAELRPGAQLLLEALDFERRARGAELILTGEGRIDRQTLDGKAPAAVAGVARKLGIPCVGVCGSVGPGVAGLYQAGFLAIHSICDGPMSLAEARRDTSRLIAECVKNIVSLHTASRDQSSTRQAVQR
ncbi:glycerate kinase, partial [Candidatus Sumerlaeota bacterium]